MREGRASSDSLLRLLDTGKKMCLLPVGAGGTVGIGLLGQGHYALRGCDPCGRHRCHDVAMSLILLSCVAFGSMIVQWAVRGRGPNSGPRRPTIRINLLPHKRRIKAEAEAEFLQSMMEQLARVPLGQFESECQTLIDVTRRMGFAGRAANSRSLGDPSFADSLQVGSFGAKFGS